MKKKGIYLVIAMMFAFGAFAACGGSNDDSSTSTGGSGTSIESGNSGSSDGGSNDSGSSGGDVVTPAPATVKDAIETAAENKSKVTFGFGKTSTEYADPAMADFNEGGVISYRFGDGFTYINNYGTEIWHSVDKNGGIFSITGGNLTDSAKNEMLDGYGFSYYTITGAGDVYYGVDAFLDSLYTQAAETEETYQQYLADAQEAGNATLVANAQAVIANFGFNEMVKDGVYSFHFFSVDKMDGKYYSVDVSFTLSNENYVETFNVVSTAYASTEYATEDKMVTEGNAEESVDPTYVTLYTLNEDATLDNTSKISVAQNTYLTFDNEYDPDDCLLNSFTLSVDGETIEDGAKLTIDGGEKVNFDVTVPDDANLQYSSCKVYLMDEEEGFNEIDLDNDCFSAGNNIDYASENEEYEGFFLKGKKCGTYTLKVVYGAATRTFEVTVAPAINVYTNDENGDKIEEASVYTNVAVYLYTDICINNNDVSYTYSVNDTENASVTTDEYDYTTFKATKAGTYVVTVTATADSTLTDTITITVTEKQKVSSISGTWNGSVTNRKGTTSFSFAFEDNKVTITSGDKTGVYTYAIGAYNDWLELDEVDLTYVSGDEITVADGLLVDEKGNVVINNNYNPVNCTKEGSEGEGFAEVEAILTTYPWWGKDSSRKDVFIVFNEDGTGIVQDAYDDLDVTTAYMFNWTVSIGSQEGCYSINITDLEKIDPETDDIAVTFSNVELDISGIEEDFVAIYVGFASYEPYTGDSIAEETE